MINDLWPGMRWSTLSVGLLAGRQRRWLRRRPRARRHRRPGDASRPIPGRRRLSDYYNVDARTASAFRRVHARRPASAACGDHLGPAAWSRTHSFATCWADKPANAGSADRAIKSTWSSTGRLLPPLPPARPGTSHPAVRRILKIMGSGAARSVSRDGAVPSSSRPGRRREATATVRHAAREFREQPGQAMSSAKSNVRATPASARAAHPRCSPCDQRLFYALAGGDIPSGRRRDGRPPAMGLFLRNARLDSASWPPAARVCSRTSALWNMQLYGRSPPPPRRCSAAACC